MVVCKFWQQGNCRFGDSCRFEHPRRDVIPNGNRFAALQSPEHSRNNRSQQRNGIAGEAPYSLDKQAIVIDLSSERRQWILSAYGPGRYAPAQLFGGPLREQSPEEIRVKHYMGLAAGNPQQAAQNYESLVQASEQQIRTALNDVDGAINFIIKAENEHPNRLDICQQSRGNPGGVPNPTTTQSASAPNPFGAPSQPASNPFGGQRSQTKSAFGQPSTTSAFGQPSAPSAFGQPSTTSAFSQPSATSAFGQPSTAGGAFGQPSALGQKPSAFGSPSTASAFGAPSQLGNTGAFGRPSLLGQKPSPFGAPSAAAAQSTSSGFSSFAGSGNAFQQAPAAAPNPFGAPSQPAFGAPSQPGIKPNPFGAPSQPATNPNPFGAPSQPTPAPFGAPSQLQANPLGQPSGQTPNAFAQPSAQTPSPFGQPSVQNPNPFGQPSAPNPLSPVKQPPFGAPHSAPSNPFGVPGNHPPTTTIQPNPFGAPTSSTPISPFSNPTPPSAPSSLNPLSNSTNHQPPQINGTTPSDLDLSKMTLTHPPLSSYTTKAPTGHLLTFKNQRVTYRDGTPFVQKREGGWERVWFPEGPPGFNRDTELKEEEIYEDEELKLQYLFAREVGGFKQGVVPMVPPRREWCLWDF